MILPTPLQKLVGNECKIGQNSNPWNNMLIFSSDMSREFLTYILSHIYLYLPHKKTVLQILWLHQTFYYDNTPY